MSELWPSHSFRQHLNKIQDIFVPQIQHVCFLHVFYPRTPLHYAAASRHYQCLETLVSCGTCINATDQWGRSALHYAAASDLDRRYSSMLSHVFFPCWFPKSERSCFASLVCLAKIWPGVVCRTWAFAYKPQVLSANHSRRSKHLWWEHDWQKEK